MRRPRLHLALLATTLGVALLAVVPTALAVDSGTLVFQGKRFTDTLIYTMKADGSPGGKGWGPGIQPTISRDGKTIVYVKAGQGGGTALWVRELDDKSPARRLTDDPGSDSQPSISADGQTVVFVGSRPDQGTAIYSIGIDGKGERRLTHGGGTYSAPSGSPDGKRIVFVGGVAGAAQVETMNLDGSDVVQLTKAQEPFDEVERPSFSPDGRRVIFGAKAAKRDRIYVCDAKDGGNLVELTKGDETGAEPAYSPNGAAIAFRRGADLYTMNADGTGVTRLTRLGTDSRSGPALNNKRPSWGG